MLTQGKITKIEPNRGNLATNEFLRLKKQTKINIVKESKSHKMIPKHIFPIEMVKSMGSNRKDNKKMSLEFIYSSILATWLNFRDFTLFQYRLELKNI